jgi:hypothetical protein
MALLRPIEQTKIMFRTIKEMYEKFGLIDSMEGSGLKDQLEIKIKEAILAKI